MATHSLYRTFDLATKVEVLKEVDKGGTTKQDIARPITLSNFIKNKRLLLIALENNKFKMRTSA